MTDKRTDTEARPKSRATNWAKLGAPLVGGLARAMSGAAYSAYIVHPLVLVPLAIALRGVRLDLALKFVLFAPLFVGVTFLLAYGIKQLPVARDIV